MTEIAETVSDAVERAREGSLNSIVAASVALLATFMALCNVKDGNIVQAMAQVQAQAVDTWSYFQAKSQKQALAESTLDALRVQRELAPAAARALLDAKLAEYEAKVARYDREKADVEKQARGFEADYDALNVHDDQFDMADAFASVALALLGITALTKKRALLAVALGFGAFAVLFGVAGFAGLDLHPSFLARLLG
jgi:hypothetical protein